MKPNDDFDRDGLSNMQEYIAGTSPIDAQSVFAVAATAPLTSPGGSKFIIH